MTNITSHVRPDTKSDLAQAGAENGHV